MALPGNGTIPAPLSARRRLAKHAGMQIMELIKRDIKPRDILTSAAFHNAETVDMALGCSTNTMLHLPAIAHEAGVSIDLTEANHISANTPNLCHLAPAGDTFMEDLERAGGVYAVMAELAQAGLLDTGTLTCTGRTVAENLEGVVNRNEEIIRPLDNPYSRTGGIAVLKGNLAPDGCVVKTAGVPPEIWKFRGPALVVDSQEQAIEVILNDTLKPGMALVIRYEGPKGGPGMQEMLYPTSFVKGKGIGKQVAMLTDGRYSGGSSGLAIGHMAPEAANKGPVALIKNGDIIDIDIEARSVNVELTDEQLDERRRELEAGDGYVAHRNRHVSQALKAYAAFARSADKGATRDPELINKLSGLN